MTNPETKKYIETLLAWVQRKEAWSVWKKVARIFAHCVVVVILLVMLAVPWLGMAPETFWQRFFVILLTVPWALFVATISLCAYVLLGAIK